MKKGYVDVPEGQIHYKTDGSGENLLLLHQAPMSSDEFDGMIPILARHYCVFAMDALGHGNSDDPPHEYEVEDFARNVVNFMDALGIDRTSIAGHHTGALIAFEVAATYPERVEKLVCSGAPVVNTERFQGLLKQPMTRDLPMTDDGQFIMKTWERYRAMSMLTDPKASFKPFLISLKARTRPYDAHYAAGRYNAKKHVGSLKCPILLISGSKDMFFVNEMEATKKLIPNCQARVIEGGGTFICFEKPEAFAQVIIDFLK